jgi:fructokinase
MRKILVDADYVKLNEHELMLLSHDLSVQADQGGFSGLTQSLKAFALDHSIEILILTRGSRGAVLYHGGQTYGVDPAPQTQVVDTVGAGDGFAAAMLLGLRHQWPLPATLERASAFASLLVARRGATIDDPAVYQTLLQSWMGH